MIFTYKIIDCLIKSQELLHHFVKFVITFPIIKENTGMLRFLLVTSKQTTMFIHKNVWKLHFVKILLFINNTTVEISKMKWLNFCT